jgi:FkbM family methyltransferase
MSYDFYPDPMNLEVDLPNQYVVLHTTTNWPNRTWDKNEWQKLIDWLSDNKIFTVLIGFGYNEKLHESLSDQPLEKVCPDFNNLYGIDLTNQGSVSDMWWVINGSSCIITMDSGPLHIAGCTDTQILQLGSAINPKFRAPFRNGSQDYKYHFIGGDCEIFCNSNLFYNVLHWGDINHIPPQPGCLENKPKFECHPPLQKVITKIQNLVNFEENPVDYFFELLPKDDQDKIKYNFKNHFDKNISITVRDLTTGLIRDRLNQKITKADGYYWWTPSPGRLENLGDIELSFEIDGKFFGTKKIYYSGGKEIKINDKKITLENLKGHLYPIFWEIEVNGEYENEYGCTVYPDDIVLDIGANYGFFTMYSLNKGARKVYSVEPFPDAYNHLESLSQNFNQIFPINKAVSTEIGTTSFLVHSDTSAVNCLSTHGNINNMNYQEIEVETIDINTLIQNLPEKINFMKVDCEGAEYELFQTITNTNLKRIERLVIETHDLDVDTFVYNRLSDNNFQVNRRESYANNGGSIMFATKL